jgi:hypothetical protein
MTEHQIIEHEDGTFSYRGWRLEKIICTPGDSVACGCGRPKWTAYIPHEMDNRQALDLWLLLPNTAGAGGFPWLISRHTSGDPFPSPTVEACIDKFEAGIERLRAEAFAPFLERQ